MIKFSTKTNYKIVSQVQKIILFLFNCINKPIRDFKVKRQGIHWYLNLSEVIDFMIFLVGGFDKQGGKAFGIKLNPDDTIVDIGANIGSFSLVISKYLGDNGQVIAVEPSHYAYNKFKYNMSLNPILSKKIRPIQAFITRKQFPIPDGIHASWDIQSETPRHPNHKGIMTSTQGAIGLSLDQLVNQFKLKKVDWIKIDVDGFEKDVLLGGQFVFKHYRPNIFMELCEYSLVEHHTSIEEILSFLIQFNYHFFSVKGKEFGQDIRAIKKTIPNMGTTNIFAYQKNN